MILTCIQENISIYDLCCQIFLNFGFEYTYFPRRIRIFNNNSDLDWILLFDEEHKSL